MSLGVAVGKYDADKQEFKCAVSQETLERLDPHWGRFYWGLQEVHK